MAVTKTRADDERILLILHLLEGEGMSASDVGERFGITRSAVLGYKHRALVDGYDHDDQTTKPENLDGAMGPMWWRKAA